MNKFLNMMGMELKPINEESDSDGDDGSISRGSTRSAASSRASSISRMSRNSHDSNADSSYYATSVDDGEDSSCEDDDTSMASFPSERASHAASSTYDNTYDSRQLIRGQKDMNRRAVHMQNLSRRTDITGVVPTNANRLPKRSAWMGYAEDDLATTQKCKQKPPSGMSWMDTEAALQKPLEDGKSGDGKRKNTWEDMFEPMKFDNPGKPVGINAVASNISNSARQFAQDDIAIAQGWSKYDRHKDMTLGVASKEELDQFRKTQLVPFYGAKSYGNKAVSDARTDANMQRRVELFTGDVGLKPPKKEVPAFFKPQKGLSNVFGTPVMAQSLMERQIVSTRRDGERPFMPEQVTPGLNYDYNQQAQGQLHPSMNYRPLPRTVDEIRTANKKRQSNVLPLMPGMKGQGAPIIGKVSKNRVSRTFEMDPKDMLPTGSLNEGPALRGTYRPSHSMKEDLQKAYVGNPGGVVSDIGDNGAFNLRPQVQETKRFEYDPYQTGPAYAPNTGTQQQNFQQYANQRLTTEKNTYVAPGYQNSGNVVWNPNDTPDATMRNMHTFNSVIGGVMSGPQQVRAPLMDTARATQRETLPENPLGIMTGNMLGNLAVNWKDLPRMTGRETIGATNFVGPIDQMGLGGYQSNPQQAKTTLRQDYDQTQYVGPTDQISRGGYQSNPQQAKTTLRQNYDDTQYLGQTEQNTRGGYQSNPQQAKTTMRQTMAETKQLGVADPDHQVGGYQSNPQQAKTNLRQGYDQTQYLGQTNQMTRGGYQSNPQQAKTTLRQDYDQTQYLGPTDQISRGGYQSNPQKAKTTLRQDYDQTQYLGPTDQISRGGYQSNPQKAKTTLRQDYDETQYLGLVDQMSRGGYQSNPQQAKTNLRQGYGQTQYLGPTDQISRGGYQSNPQQVKTTLRQDYDETQYLGPTDQISRGGYQSNPQQAKGTMRQFMATTKRLASVDQSDNGAGGYQSNPQHAKTTLRQDYGQSARNGLIGQDKGNGYVSNPQQAKTTIRQGYAHSVRNGAVGQDRGNGYVSNPQQAKGTMRQFMAATKRNGLMGQDMGNGYISNPQQAMSTLRQEYEQTEYLGGVDGNERGGYQSEKPFAKPTARQGTLFASLRPMGSEVEASKPYDAYYRAETHDREAPGRMETGGIDIGYNNDYTSYRLNDNKSFNSRVEAGSVDMFTGSECIGSLTKTGTKAPQESVRLDPGILTQLDSNPYVIRRNVTNPHVAKMEGYSMKSDLEISSMTQL
jgi:hypothetical protein